MKKKQKNEKKTTTRQFWKKKSKKKKMKKMGKKHEGKVKAEFSTSSILNFFFDKDNFEKNMWGNIVAKEKQCRETL